MSFNILKRLDFNDKEVLKLCYLIEKHDSLNTEKEITENKELAIIKFRIQCCDALAYNPSKLEKRIKYLLNINEKINSEKERDKCKKLISKFL